MESYDKDTVNNDTAMDHFTNSNNFAQPKLHIGKIKQAKKMPKVLPQLKHAYDSRNIALSPQSLSEAFPNPHRMPVKSLPAACLTVIKDTARAKDPHAPRWTKKCFMQAKTPTTVTPRQVRAVRKEFLLTG